MTIRNDARIIVVNVLSQVVWVSMVAGSTAMLIFLFGTTDARAILSSQVQVPTAVVLAAALAAMAGGLFVFVTTRKASAVRGRADATSSNLDLLRARKRVSANARVVRSTRFGSWPPAEILQQRSAFRDELDRAILREGADVRRIWNVSSTDDVERLREILRKYEGRDNHSIRAYFDLPYHALPELLVVDGMGASMSFPSMRTPRGLDWMIRYRRRDLVNVVRDYFDVLWDRAERILDSGVPTDDCHQRLQEVEQMMSARAVNVSDTID